MRVLKKHPRQNSSTKRGRIMQILEFRTTEKSASEKTISKNLDTNYFNNFFLF